VTRTTAKERERTILGVVYTPDEVARFSDDERPDFTAPVQDEETKRFGVEVTEFYLSDSHARLRRIRGYVADVFGGRYRHARDRHELPIETVTITPHAGGDDRHVAALIQRFPETGEHLRLLAEAIRDKGLKAKKYATLQHLNLILVDRLQRWGKLTSESLCKLLTSEQVPAAVWRSPFREVFYVTALGDKWVYVPVVMHTMMAELFGFALVVGPHVPREHDCLKTVLEAFGHHLLRRSRGAVLVRGNGAEYEILHRRYGVLLSDEKGVIVHDYVDCSCPRDSRALSAKDPLPLPRRLMAQRLRRYHDAHSFECDVVAPAKAPPPP